MKRNNVKILKKVTALILAVTMVPLGDFANVKGAQEETQSEVYQPETKDVKELEDLSIKSDFTLDSDMEVNNLVHESGILNLNGHVLKVHGNYTGSMGSLSFGGGSLYCLNNFTSGISQRILMNNANDYLHIDGTATIDTGNYYAGDVSNGQIDVTGDLTISSAAFNPSGYSRIVLSGNGSQTVNVKAGTELNIVELKNYSSEGILCTVPVNCNSFITNGCIMAVCGSKGSYGYTLEEDTVIDEEYVMIADTLNLNGHTLTVKGDFIQMGGCVDVNGGILNVEGDYRIQSRTDNNGEYSYGISAGRLKMTGNRDYVKVNGDFITSSSCRNKDYLTDGILEVKGDFTVDTSYSRNNFMPSGNHKVLLSGGERQAISFGYSYSNGSSIANLEISNHSKEGVVAEKKPCVTGNVNDNGCRITGYIVPSSTITFTDDTYHGDLYIDSYISLSGNYNIQGNVYSTCYEVTFVKCKSQKSPQTFPFIKF